MKILALGEIIWDVYPDEKHIGGAPLNFAAHAALLGAESYLLSAVGSDELAEPALEELKKFGVHTDFIRTVADKPTGQCLVTLDDKGVPQYKVLTDTAYDHLSAEGDFADFDAIAFGTLFQRSEQNVSVLKNILKNNKFSEIFCDLNLRKPHYSKESALLCANSATILKISREELPETCSLLLSKELSAPATAARALASAFPNLKLIIITLDCDGAFVFDTACGKSYFAPPKKVKAVSTVGAGDSFSAAFLESYLRDRDIDKALDRAITLSAFVVSKKEAVPAK